MERYMVHLHNEKYDRHDAASILQQARSLTNNDVTIRDVRVSDMHIEMDITIPDNTLDNTMMTICPIANMLDAHHITQESVDKKKAILDGIAYFNAERYWESHEAFEGAWKESFEGEKDLLQGIILVAAGFVHYQKNQDVICLSIFKRALQKLSSCTGIYHKIDVEQLKTKVHHTIQSKRITTFQLV
ncbi:MAG: DUF309 domain-containing protein [Cenarchaeum sp. SB0662_bin_33]|nr:DUF309 domain-containing protein [Cenarchaeum sp. SB0662_bin_33]